MSHGSGHASVTLLGRVFPDRGAIRDRRREGAQRQFWYPSMLNSAWRVMDWIFRCLIHAGSSWPVWLPARSWPLACLSIDKRVGEGAPLDQLGCDRPGDGTARWRPTPGHASSRGLGNSRGRLMSRVGGAGGVFLQAPGQECRVKVHQKADEAARCGYQPKEGSRCTLSDGIERPDWASAWPMRRT